MQESHKRRFGARFRRDGEKAKHNYLMHAQGDTGDRDVSSSIVFTVPVHTALDG